MSDHSASDFDLQCPGWCRAQHGDEIHPDDRRHESEIVVVPVAENARTSAPAGNGAVHRRPDSTEVFLVVHQQLGEPDVWVGLGVDGRGMDLSLESAQRVHQALGDLLSITRRKGA
ncbi:hypothetical protein HGQ17_07205 [Nesterenkonia sp. MY13]|uniref:Uncharacterized protein n=2 Tax=Nesterenkonia TaxID=57494 RepID=A0A7X8TK27_9MICC|nr:MULTISPECIES: hypothetical protein [Nesterenkonia]NLS09797.1 hypothetical protein [Nesterenkonia sedimenti]TLP74448.1 hypothetical protein FEF27_08830 [Nesterenkonia sphaerica]